MTVRELKEALANAPDEREVILVLPVFPVLPYCAVKDAKFDPNDSDPKFQIAEPAFYIFSGLQFDY